MTSSPAPRLTVTVTNYNYATFLPKAIESILAQSFTDYELLVIDNASTDDSLAVLHHYAAANPRIRLVTHDQNVGALASLRESCDLARGTYRVHVDADDWVISPDAFERQVAMLEQNQSMSFVFSSMTMFGPSGNKLHVAHPFSTDVVLAGVDALTAVLDFTLTHSGMMFRLDAYRASSGYPEGLPQVDDMLLGVRLCELGDVGYIDDELYAFRQHGDNVHLKPQLSVVRDEYLPVIESAFNGPLGPKVPAKVRRRVIQRALVHMPTQYVFKGKVKWGWRLWWESMKLHPFATLFQLRTLSLVARSVLGDAGFSALTRWSRR